MRLIIDTDPGIDDALALLYALGSTEARIEAITTVAGNVGVDKATRNAQFVLRHAAVDPAQLVFRGCGSPLYRKPVHAFHVHGEDGLAGLTDGAAAAPAGVDAAQTILQLAARYPGEITLLALGPLTNVATALLRDRETFALLRRAVVMGGAIEWPGNVTPVAEFNFHADPHAAREVLRGPVPLLVVPLDLTRRAILRKTLLNEWLDGRLDARARFVETLCERYFQFYESLQGSAHCYLHDPLATAIAIDSTLACASTVELDVETEGEFAAGMIVRDLRPGRSTGCKVQIATDCRWDEFFHRFHRRVLAT